MLARIDGDEPPRLPLRPLTGDGPRSLSDLGHLLRRLPASSATLHPRQTPCDPAVGESWITEPHQAGRTGNITGLRSPAACPRVARPASSPQASLLKWIVVSTSTVRIPLASLV